VFYPRAAAAAERAAGRGLGWPPHHVAVHAAEGADHAALARGYQMEAGIAPCVHASIRSADRRSGRRSPDSHRDTVPASTPRRLAISAWAVSVWVRYRRRALLPLLSLAMVRKMPRGNVPRQPP